MTSVALLSTSDKYFCISSTILASVANVNISPSITDINDSRVFSSESQQLFRHPNSLMYGYIRYHLWCCPFLCVDLCTFIYPC